MTVPRNNAVVIGMPQLERALDQWSDELKAAVRDVVRESAEELRDDERDHVPVDTGQTRDGIDIEYSNDDLSAEVGQSDSERAHIAEFLENGTSSMAARPYAAPAAELQRARLPGRIAAKVSRIRR